MREMDAYTVAWLSELWSPCREMSRTERDEKRKNDRAKQRQIEDHAAVNSASTLRPQVFPQVSTSCAENGASGFPEGHAECA